MFLRSALLSFFLLTLAGCGLTPLNNLSHEGKTLEVIDVFVESIPEKQGVLLRQHLEANLTKGNRERNSRYILRVDYKSSERATVVSTKNTDSRNEVEGSAAFSLVDTTTGKTIFNGTSVLHNAYSVGQRTTFAAYSTHISQRDSQEKILSHLAEDIAHQIRVHLARSKSSS